MQGHLHLPRLQHRQARHLPQHRQHRHLRRQRPNHQLVAGAIGATTVLAESTPDTGASAILTIAKSAQVTVTVPKLRQRRRAIWIQTLRPRRRLAVTANGVMITLAGNGRGQERSATLTMQRSAQVTAIAPVDHLRRLRLLRHLHRLLRRQHHQVHQVHQVHQGQMQ